MFNLDDISTPPMFTIVALGNDSEQMRQLAVRWNTVVQSAALARYEVVIEGLLEYQAEEVDRLLTDAGLIVIIRR